MSREFADWYGHRAGSTVTYGLFGGRPVTGRVVAVLDGGSAVPSLLLPPGSGGGAAAPRAAVLLGAEAAGSPRAAAAELTARFGADRVRVVPSEEWFSRAAGDRDRLNRLVLGVLAVPASLYALIAVAGVLVMAYSRRGREVAGMRLIGVSAGQVRRMALWETLSTSLLGVVIAAGVVAVGARAYRGALAVFGGEPPLRVEWGVLGALTGACVLVGVVVSRAAVGRLLRHAGVAGVASRE
ncbi:FtsX-like permease family protein [Streptomyces sp. CC228A]|uniref:FtsX-like permease family protein n=1 Tax=Streptomyces sp. CC228A TaxID=2898186 RepID=UPI001F294036|nr:FtsX-like permease family protein [Streptomyces sp. CC228A]